MGYLILIAIILTLLLLLRNSYKRIAGINQQLAQILSFGHTNEEIRGAGTNKQLLALAKRINQLIQRHKQQEHRQLLENQQLRKEITNISHDLRTPLTSIKGFTELLQEELSIEKKKEYQELVLKKIVILEAIIELFYQTSQLESDDFILKKEYFSFEELFSATFLPYYPDFLNKKIQMSIEPQHLTKKVLVDELATKRVFSNVIQNALRYAKTELRIEIEEVTDYMIVHVENDMNIPMKDEESAQIFDRTYTIDQSREAGQTGLGLYIAQQLMRKQQGEITALYDHEKQRFCLAIRFPKKASWKNLYEK